MIRLRKLVVNRPTDLASGTVREQGFDLNYYDHGPHIYDPALDRCYTPRSLSARLGTEQSPYHPLSNLGLHRVSAGGNDDEP